MSSFAGLRLAVGLLTIVPVRPPEEVGRPEARTAMVLAPIAVLPVALIVAGLGQGAILLGIPSMIAGVLVVAALAYGTRAMHLDGLADTTDGLGSGKPEDTARAIMKRSDIGPMGVTALVLSLGTQALAAGVLLERPFGWLYLAVLICISRGSVLMGCLHGVPAARPDGLGAMVANSVPLPAAAIGWTLLAAAAAGTGILTGQPWWLPVIGVLLAFGAAWWLLARCVARFGGITGDVLGALTEVVASVLLVVATIS